MNELILTTYGVLFAGLLWFIKSKMNSYDEKHGKHFEHETDFKIHQTPDERKALAAAIQQQFKAHEQLDHERFGRIEETMKEMRGDIKEILRSVKR